MTLHIPKPGDLVYTCEEEMPEHDPPEIRIIVRSRAIDAASAKQIKVGITVYRPFGRGDVEPYWFPTLYFSEASAIAGFHARVTARLAQAERAVVRMKALLEQLDAGQVRVVARKNTITKTGHVVDADGKVIGKRG